MTWTYIWKCNAVSVLVYKIKCCFIQGLEYGNKTQLWPRQEKYCIPMQNFSDMSVSKYLAMTRQGTFRFALFILTFFIYFWSPHTNENIQHSCLSLRFIFTHNNACNIYPACHLAGLSSFVWLSSIPVYCAAIPFSLHFNPLIDIEPASSVGYSRQCCRQQNDCDHTHFSRLSITFCLFCTSPECCSFYCNIII